MNESYERDLDLNLLRVLVLVAEEGSVTRAAARLYVTQPAVSAALSRLERAVGVPLFERQGRSVVLTGRGRRLVDESKPHLRALLDAALLPPVFDPSTSTRTFRIGVSDDVELTLLPHLIKRLSKVAPGVRLIVTSLQFRTVIDALISDSIDVAVTVADDAPASIAREALAPGSFVCLFDERYAPWHKGHKSRLTPANYLAANHVVVSYNGDTRGIVEDALGLQRRVACSVPRFGQVGAIVHGTALLATIPTRVADVFLRHHRHLKTTTLPFVLPTASLEMLWPRARSDDDGHAWLREVVRQESAVAHTP